ncbi:Hypothetical protein CINCED_3A024027 [Cinara cedri]|uniref:Uncharacterized protein n=1 Tax=Cinara cedri TaxID=506608 RepID=A0A5E4NLI4_9HEMI|nr:Hypothetical protein CINCED_3A024027 [Cinara cedri]
MDKDLINLKKWFNNLGLEVDGSVEDEVLKKLVPPQRRDMWRNIIKHVLPKEEVELIKKSILLHKLQKRQKPLMAKVECDDDYTNALKYEELVTKLNSIQKDIVIAEANNTKIKDEINEKMQYKKNLMKNIELKQNKCYLTKYQTEYYEKFIEQFEELSNMCIHFSPETNEVLTKTDYEDSLIKCLTEVDEIKQSGKMIESIQIGKKLSNFIFASTSEKCPAILLQTIEDNLMKHINESNDIITQAKEIVECNGDSENVFNESLGNIFQIQLELKSKLSSSVTEKKNTINHLKNTTQRVKNEIISQFKLRNITCSGDELLAFQKNVEESLRFVIKNTIDSYDDSKTIQFQENKVFQKESFKMIDDILKKTNDLNDEIFQKKVSVCNMLKELYNKKSDFGLMDVKNDMHKLYVTYMDKIDNSYPINKTITSIDNFAFVVENTPKLITDPKPNTIYFWNLKVLKHYSKTIEILSEVMSKFEQFHKVKSTENILNLIEQKENVRKKEFNNILSQMENNILELDIIIENCELTAAMVLTKRLQHLFEK